MEVQTQVIDEPQQVYTREQMQNQVAVAEYKDSLSHIRLNRISVAQQVNGISFEVRGLVESKDNLLQMFRSEAEAMYPEIQGQDAFDVMATLSASHPLYSLWDQYKGQLDAVIQDIKSKFIQLDELEKAFEEYTRQEQVIFESYTKYYETCSTPIPTPKELLADLQAVEVIPYAEEKSLRADLNAIELLDPMAAAMVTLQTLEVAREGDYSESPEQLETQENMQIRPMAFSYDEEFGSPTIPQVAAMAQSVVSQVHDPAVANQKLRTMGLWIGAAAFAYLFLGSKK